MNRKDFFARLNDRSADEFRKIQRAYWLSKNGHVKQFRDSGERVFEHPRRVALIVLNAGRQKTEAIVVALLHDLLEDSVIPLDVVASEFGAVIWRAVETVSKRIALFDPVDGRVIARIKKNPDRYFREIAGAEDWVRIVKVADRLDNLRTCGPWDVERKARYVTETRERILPISEATHPLLTSLLKQRIAEVEKDIETARST